MDACCLYEMTCNRTELHGSLWKSDVSLQKIDSMIMYLFRFFKKKQEFRNYKSSDHSSIYEKIAKELNNKAQHVYEIAHGKACKCYDDFVIADRLIRNGILRW